MVDPKTVEVGDMASFLSGCDPPPRLSLAFEIHGSKAVVDPADAVWKALPRLCLLGFRQ
jgi:hypothetical protein